MSRLYYNDLNEDQRAECDALHNFLWGDALATTIARSLYRQGVHTVQQLRREFVAPSCYGSGNPIQDYGGIGVTAVERVARAFGLRRTTPDRFTGREGLTHWTVQRRIVSTVSFDLVRNPDGSRSRVPFEYWEDVRTEMPRGEVDPEDLGHAVLAGHLAVLETEEAPSLYRVWVHEPLRPEPIAVVAEDSLHAHFAARGQRSGGPLYPRQHLDPAAVSLLPSDLAAWLDD
ncbi:hypothetical protein ACIBBE_23930 [Streptomyces sp. NPDC051644]|uniref:hypothetical protein n=1 Tax=Streptomyces sp. NPDC051644 TaxID=3365666 RepID=UPI0037A46486